MLSTGESKASYPVSMQNRVNANENKGYGLAFDLDCVKFAGIRNSPLVSASVSCHEVS